MKSRIKRSHDPLIKPITRRSLIDWMGKATVLGLTGKLMAACSPDGSGLSDDDLDASAEGQNPGSNSQQFDGGKSQPDGGLEGERDSATGEPEGEECVGEDGFPFEPGEKEHPVYKNWGERTVDPQDLVEIIKSWRLKVDGLAEGTADLGFAEVLELERQDQVTDFHCVEGWSVHDVPWNGVHLKTLMDLVNPLPSATHITFHTQGDAYNESLPLDVALEPKTLLAYGLGCSTLPLSHGFPLRLVVPRKYGYKGPKYVYRIELTDEPISGYWVAYGYPYDGDVQSDRLRPGKF